MWVVLNRFLIEVTPSPLEFVSCLGENTSALEYSTAQVEIDFLEWAFNSVLCIELYVTQVNVRSKCPPRPTGESGHYKLHLSCIAELEL